MSSPRSHRSSCSLPLSAIAAQSPAGQRASIDLATVTPSLFDQFGLPLIFQRPLGKGFAQPCIEAARMNQQHPTHGPDRKDQPVLSNERIPHRDSLAKYAVAFLRNSLFVRKRGKGKAEGFGATLEVCEDAGSVALFICRGSGIMIAHAKPQGVIK
jgi:hypothetical protein